MDIIRVENLTKKFKNFTAVDNINFTVRPGEIFGFLGPNGAGKSTTISLLTTLLQPTGGRAWVKSFDVVSDRDAVRQNIGLVFQDPSLDERLTAEENLRFHARLYRVPAAAYPARLEEVLRLVDLWDRQKNLVKTFSGGMKRRLEIARGLIHYPAVLFLDEPTLGLDPQTRANLWDYILKLKREKNMTIFMTTHYLNEAEYCDRIAIIDRGRITALDTPANLKKALGGDVITLQSVQAARLIAEIREKFQLAAEEKNGEILLKITAGEKFLPRLLARLHTEISAVTLRKPTLDDVFLNLTGRQIREENASPKDRLRAHNRMRGPK